jgi:glycosyltransferase involved in cell wall biosynthesis
MEWRLADMILGASSFVIDGLLQHQVPQEKCRIVPYGVCLEHFFPEERRPSSSPGKLRVLFAGGVQLRKGVPYLLEALRLLNSPYIEARFAGPVEVSPAKLAPYRALATLLGLVTRARMADLFRWADVFVFPSICEGSALVTYEALASGLPVIATPNTGSWVRHGTDGMIVPVRDVEALATALERFARDRQFLRFCSRNAVADRSRLGLEAYQQKLLEVCSEVNRRMPADEKI